MLYARFGDRLQKRNLAGQGWINLQHMLLSRKNNQESLQTWELACTLIHGLEKPI